MKNDMNIHKLLPNLAGRHYSWTPEGDQAVIGKRLCVTLQDDLIDLWFADWDSWTKNDYYESPLHPITLGNIQSSWSFPEKLIVLDGEAYGRLPLSRLDELREYLAQNRTLVGISPKKQLSELQRANLQAGRKLLAA